MNDMSYTVQLKNQDFDTQKYNRDDILQIRYSRRSPIATAMRTVFSRTNAMVEQQAVSGVLRERAVMPEKQQEYIMVYAAADGKGLLLEPITADDIRQEMNQFMDIPEMTLVERLSTDETAGINEMIRMTKVRKMNQAIGNSLKSLYRYRCCVTRDHCC